VVDLNGNEFLKKQEFSPASHRPRQKVDATFGADLQTEGQEADSGKPPDGWADALKH